MNDVDWNARANDLALALEVANDHIDSLKDQLNTMQMDRDYLRDYVIPEKDKHGKYWETLAQERIAKIATVESERDETRRDDITLRDQLAAVLADRKAAFTALRTFVDVRKDTTHWGFAEFVLDIQASFLKHHTLVHQFVEEIHAARTLPTSEDEM